MAGEVYLRSGSPAHVGLSIMGACPPRTPPSRRVAEGESVSRACAGASPSRATSRCRCRGPAAATASTARSPPTGRTCTAPRRSSRCSTGPPAGGSRSCWCSPASARRSTPRSASGCASYGHEDFTGYVVWTCERALERGLLPHTNLGVLSREDLARLREVSASQGLMLESISERLMETVHAGSPTKHPARRLETIRAAGELRIPFTSGILVGIGESRGGAPGLAAGARRGARRVRAHPGGDPAELRPPPALLRARAGHDRRRGGSPLLADRGRRRSPWRCRFRRGPRR